MRLDGSLEKMVFIKSKSDYLDTIILDAVSTIYSADNANYFLSENLSFLPQCAEKISFKAPAVQEKFFHLIEFLVHQLKYVPCKELIAISLIFITIPLIFIANSSIVIASSSMIITISLISSLFHCFLLLFHSTNNYLKLHTSNEIKIIPNLPTYSS